MSVRDAEDLSSLLPALRELHDLLVSAVSSDLPTMILERGAYFRCDPNHPEIANAQVWAEVLGRGVQALDTAARNREIRSGQDGCAA